MDILEFIKDLLLDIWGIEILENDEIRNDNMLLDEEVKVVVFMRNFYMREIRRMMNSNNNHHFSKILFQIYNINGK